MRKTGIAALVLTFTAGIGLAVTSGTPRALADGSQQQICVQSAYVPCLNDWNGANTYVKMGNYNWTTNNDFEVIFNTSQCGGGRVTAVADGDAHNCPFGITELDHQLHGYPLGQVEYVPTGQCIGTTASGTGYLGTCAGNNGSGGQNGTNDVIESAAGLLINKYWSDAYNGGTCCIYYGYGGGGSQGSPVYLWSSPMDSWTGF